MAYGRRSARRETRAQPRLGHESQDVSRSNFCPISSRFRLNNSKNLLASSRAGVGRLAERGLSPRGMAMLRGGDGVKRIIPSHSLVDVAGREFGVGHCVIAHPGWAQLWVFAPAAPTGMMP